MKRRPARFAAVIAAAVMTVSACGGGTSDSDSDASVDDNAIGADASAGADDDAAVSADGQPSDDDASVAGTQAPEAAPPTTEVPRPHNCLVETCRLLVVGDSVSDGVDTWRERFRALASEAGYQFEEVGARRFAAPGEEIPFQDPPFDPAPGEDDQYEAYGGACIGDGGVTDCGNLSETVPFRGTDRGLWGRIDIWSEIIPMPDVVVLLAGHNGGGDKAAQFEAYLEKLFTVVSEYTYVFISPNGGAAGILPELEELAERYRADGKQVFAFESYDGVTSPDMVHPDANGTRVLADNMFAGIDAGLRAAMPAA